MRLAPVKFVIIFFYFICSLYSYGQAYNFPIDKWVSELCVKRDSRLERLSALGNEITRLALPQYCEVLALLEEKGPKHNKRFRVRLSLLKIKFGMNYGFCPDWQVPLELMKEGLHLAYETEDELLVAACNQSLLKWHINHSDYGIAGMYGLIAKEIEERLGLEHFHLLAYARYDLGYMLYHSRQYESCIEVTQKAIHWVEQPGASPGDSLDRMYKVYAWNTIGLCYKKLNLYDSAFIAFDKALELIDKAGNPFWYGLIRGNQGDVYFQMGQYDSARVLLQYDYEQSKIFRQFDNAANSLHWLARIYVILGQPDAALKLAREAWQMLQQSPNPEIEAQLLYTFTRVFKSLGNIDSLDTYMGRYLVLHDKLETDAALHRAEIVQLRLDNQVSVHKILSLNKEKRRISLIRNFSIGIILLLAGLAYMDFSRQKLKIQLQKQMALEQRRLAEIEAANAREQLKGFTQNILEKSKLIEDLEQQLQRREVTSEQHQMIVDLTHQQLLTDADWDKFKALFERVYPGFFITMRDKASDITLAELRMAALIRLQLTTKESAALLGVSLDTIHKTRQRLKQRLQLAPEADLDQWIVSL